MKPEHTLESLREAQKGLVDALDELKNFRRQYGCSMEWFDAKWFELCEGLRICHVKMRELSK